VQFAYVFRLGDTGIYKVGKTNDLKKRQSAHETISTEPLVLCAQIETNNKSALETIIKHRLQSHRWMDGAGRELYKAEPSVIEEVIAFAAQWNADVMPKMAEAAKLTKQQCDGRILKPSELERELHRELMRLRQVELTAKQEMARIETELKLLMQTASQLQGIAVWKNKSSTSLDSDRLKRERRDVYDAYYTRVTHTRPFEPRW
jgi:hypothetical protein